MVRGSNPGSGEVFRTCPERLWVQWVPGQWVPGQWVPVQWVPGQAVVPTKPSVQWVPGQAVVPTKPSVQRVPAHSPDQNSRGMTLSTHLHLVQKLKKA
jgi:hypothetical protein